MEAGGEKKTDVLLCQRRQVVPTGRSDAGNEERRDSQASRLTEFIHQLRLGQAIKMNVRIKEFDHQTLTNPLRRRKRHVIRGRAQKPSATF
jgi:hypothetical protein